MAGNNPPPSDPQPTESTSCEKLNFEATLQSPVAEVLSKLTIGENVNVIYDDLNKIIKVFNLDGQFAGTVGNYKISQLIKCINEGFHYHGIVKSKNGGSCKIKIERL